MTAMRRSGAVLLALVLVPAAAPAAHGAPRTAAVEVRWSLDTDADDLLVGDIVDAVADSAGVTYLFDYRLQEILVIEPDGSLSRRIGGPGDGPGETRAAGRLFLAADGRIGALDMVAAKVTWWSTDGTPRSSSRLRFLSDGSGSLGIYDARLGSGGPVAAFMRRGNHDGRRVMNVVLARLHPDGTAGRELMSVVDGAVYREGPVTREGDLYSFVWNGWDVDRDGRVYVAAERDRPEVRVFAPDGAETTLTVPGAVPAPRSDATLARIRRMHVTRTKFEPAATPPCFARLRCDERDRLWLMTGSAAEDGAARFEVFAPDGRDLGTVDLSAAYDPRFDSAFLESSHHLVVVTNTSTGGFADDDLDFPRRGRTGMRIVCYGFDAELPGD